MDRRFKPVEMAGAIDSTWLRPEATSDRIEALCREAIRFSFASVCCLPVHAALVSRLLLGSSVASCTVVGFPLGANKTETKMLETRLALEDGVREIDMVMQIGIFKEGRQKTVSEEIRQVADLCRSQGVLLKVILETGLLGDVEKKEAARIVAGAGANFVKTCTGFGAGAEIADVVLLRKALKGTGVSIKASGGIRHAEEVARFLEAGAIRIGTSSAAGIMQEIASSV